MTPGRRKPATVIRSLLLKNGECEMIVHGRSMRPLLDSGQSVLVRAVDKEALVPGKCYAYYRRGTVFLHRFIGRRNGMLVFCGDNQTHFSHLKPNAVVGTVEAPGIARTNVLLRAFDRFLIILPRCPKRLLQLRKKWYTV